MQLIIDLKSNEYQVSFAFQIDKQLPYILTVFVEG
jgi:hypothetical protein